MGKKYTKEFHDFVVKNAPGTGNKELTKLINKRFGLNLKVSHIKSYKGNHNISSGLTGHFFKGQEPFNKGKKMKTVGRMATTQFKKGDRPLNYRPVGSERVDSKDGYILVKVSDKGKFQERWKLKHRVVWEKMNGPIPKGHRLIFLDGDRTNCDINNLKLLSFGESAYMNKKGLFFKDKEMTTAGSLIAELELKTKEKRKIPSSLKWEEVYYFQNSDLVKRRGYSCTFKGYKYGIICVTCKEKRTAIVIDWTTGFELFRTRTRLEAHAKIGESNIQRMIDRFRKNGDYNMRVKSFSKRLERYVGEAK